jgi:hypothetical protein
LWIPCYEIWENIAKSRRTLLIIIRMPLKSGRNFADNQLGPTKSWRFFSDNHKKAREIWEELR